MKTTQFFLVLISFTFSIGCSTDEIYEDENISINSSNLQNNNKLEEYLNNDILELENPGGPKKKTEI